MDHVRLELIAAVILPRRPGRSLLAVAATVFVAAACGGVGMRSGLIGGARSIDELASTELADAATVADRRRLGPDAAFVESVVTGSPAYPDFAVALEAHRIADAAYRSAAAGGQPTSV